MMGRKGRSRVLACNLKASRCFSPGPKEAIRIPAGGCGRWNNARSTLPAAHSAIGAFLRPPPLPLRPPLPLAVALKMYLRFLRRCASAVCRRSRFDC